MELSPVAELIITQPVVDPLCDDTFDLYDILHLDECGYGCYLCETLELVPEHAARFVNWPEGATGRWELSIDEALDFTKDGETFVVGLELVVGPMVSAELGLVSEAAAANVSASALMDGAQRGHYAVRCGYGGKEMRSLMEVSIAALLDLYGIGWEYETHHDIEDFYYLPDFLVRSIPKSLVPRPLVPESSIHANVPKWIEVKPPALILRYAELIGLPKWNLGDSGEQHTIGPIAVDRDLLGAELLKPFALAVADHSVVWVVGAPKPNQAFIEFRPDGTVMVSRCCPLFQNVELNDEARRIRGSLRSVTASPN